MTAEFHRVGIVTPEILESFKFAEVVTADGRHLTIASGWENSGFWAVEGLPKDKVLENLEGKKFSPIASGTDEQMQKMGATLYEDGDRIQLSNGDWVVAV